MSNLQKFYRDLFRRTHGYVFNWPMGKKLKIGDFFVIRPGGIGVVGNIYERYFQLDVDNQFYENLFRFNNPLLEPYDKKEEAIKKREEKEDYWKPWHKYKPSEDLWYFKSGCETHYRSKTFIEPHKEKTDPPAVNTYSTILKEPGDYFFSANSPFYLRMPNFFPIHKELIRRFTSQLYNLHSVYLVNEVCMADQVSIGVSNANNAELKVSANEYLEGDMVDLLQSEAWLDVERSQNMSVLKLRKKGGIIAFKAKKMGLSLKARESITDLIFESTETEIRKYSVEMMNHDLYHFFPSLEINTSNANEYFSWSDMTQEDVYDLVNQITF